MRFLGCPGQAEGCLSEYIVMPEECCFPVPDQLTAEEAAFVEPLSIGIYAMTLAGSLKGKTVGILGCGPIGLSVLLASCEAEAVYVTDKITERLEVARSAGAVWSGNPLVEDICAEVSQREPELLDVVFECCGQQEALDQAIEILKPGGSLLIIGIPPEERVSFSVDGMRRKEICIMNVRRQNGCMQAAIDFIADERHNVRSLITHHFSLDQSQQAFDLVAGYQDGVVKAVILL
jgi:L-iditol 2-dehydrogenase